MISFLAYFIFKKRNYFNPSIFTEIVFYLLLEHLFLINTVTRFFFKSSTKIFYYFEYFVTLTVLAFSILSHSGKEYEFIQLSTVPKYSAILHQVRVV